VAAYISSVLVDELMLHCSGALRRWCACTKTCRSYFNVNFNTGFKTITCAFVGE
jgi:hypothetical protein